MAPRERRDSRPAKPPAPGRVVDYSPTVQYSTEEYRNKQQIINEESFWKDQTNKACAEVGMAPSGIGIGIGIDRRLD